MPQIPRYESTRSLVKEGPAIKKSVADEVEAGTGQMFQDVGTLVKGAGDIIYDVTEKIRRIDNANTESKAAIAKKQWQIADSENRTKQVDFEHLKTLPDDVRKNTDEVAKMFKDPVYKQKWLNEQRLDDESYIITQKAFAAKKAVSERKVLVLRDLELEKSNYINSATDEDRINSIKRMEEIVNDPANTDIYDAEDKKKLVDETVKDGQDALKDIGSLKRVKEKELRLAEETAINAREKELIQMKIQDKVQREELIRLAKQDVKNKKIDAAFADRFINALKSPKAIKAKTIDKDFANIIYEINLGKMKPEAIRNAMLDLVSYGNLSENDFNSATVYLDMMTDKNVDDLVTSGRRSAWESLKNFAGANKNAEADSRARMSRAFIKKLQLGIEAQAAAIEATREEVLFLRPEARNYPEGMAFMDNDGRIKKIMPNGDLLEAETKSK